MALLLLQPGIEPLGQFDMDDTFNTVAAIAGGEVGTLVARTAGPPAVGFPLDDFYAADVGADALRGSTSSSSMMVQPDTVNLLDGGTGGLNVCTEIYGLIDEGSTGYGTLFGTIIGGTAGQGTGLGAAAGANAVVVGPVTGTGSGKATLWTKPGLYGVTQPAWLAAAADAAVVNDAVYSAATAGGAGTAGKLQSGTGTGALGCSIGVYLGATHDRSLVSTTNTAAGVALATEYHTLYLFGPGLVRTTADA